MSTKGYRHSEKTRKQMSESIKKLWEHREHKLSEETKRKMSETRKGFKLSDKQKEVLKRLSFKG